MSKARDLADSAQEINILDGKSFLDEDNLASDSATGIASQQSIKAYVDGITTTNITSTGALNSGSITSGFGNIDNGSSTITTTGAITGGSFVIGSADINENDLESIDGITAGTVAASKAVVVNANKDITGFRNLTATGTISGSLSGTLSGSLSSTTTATTQAESDDSTKVATTAYVTDKITTLIGGAPSTLNDLNELAAAINDDANYNSTLTTALGTKLAKAGGTMTGDVLYNDSVKAKFGAGSDLQIYHSGSASVIQDSGDGSLFLQGGSQIVLGNVGNSESYAIFNQDGAVQLRHNNAQKFATTSTGIDVTGNATFADSGKAIFGAGSDLQIYHDGSHSRITDAGTGSLLIDGDEVYVRSSTGENKIIADSNGGVNLFYDNASKLTTTSSGVNVTGNVTVTGTLDGRDLAADGVRLDTMATNANNYSHPNHSGEVTSSGDGAMTIANNVVDEANLKVSNSPTNGYVLSAQSGNTGGLTWAEIISGAASQSSAPTAVDGAFWIDSDTDILYVYNEGAWQDIKFVGSGNQEDGGHLFTNSHLGSFENNNYNNPTDATYTFTVPTGIENISVVCIGRGYKNSLSFNGNNGSGGNPAGGLAYKNNISCTSGDQFTVTLNGSYSRFYKSGVCDVRGNVGSGTTGGTFSGGDGGGQGGHGGNNTYGGSLYVGTGGGGAGGYGAAGGQGGNGSGLSAGNGQNGNSGGGGGGGNSWTATAGSGYSGGAYGGGTAPYGQGSNGSGGSGDTNSGNGTNAVSGGGGSGNTASFPTSTQVQDKIFFGAGPHGGYAVTSAGSRTTMAGCVRVVWGQGSNQSFPSTNVNYRSNEVLN